MATLADLNWYLSGGLSNTSPDSSLGGSKGALIGSQTVSGSMAGVTVDRSEGNAAGVGALTFDATNTALSWAAAGDAAGESVDVSAGGEFVLFSGGEGYLVVTVSPASLPGANDSQAVTVTQNRNNLFDDITKDESFDGDTEYRCFYVWNDHASDPLVDCAAYIASQPGGADSVEIGLDPAGVNDGSSAAVTVANESSAPAGVTFSAPADSASALSIGDIPAGQGIAIWVKRTVPARTLAGHANDTMKIAVEVRY
jgi:hypothetical protein